MARHCLSLGGYTQDKGRRGGIFPQAEVKQDDERMTVAGHRHVSRIGNSRMLDFRDGSNAGYGFNEDGSYSGGGVGWWQNQHSLNHYVEGLETPIAVGDFIEIARIPQRTMWEDFYVWVVNPEAGVILQPKLKFKGDKIGDPIDCATNFTGFVRMDEPFFDGEQEECIELEVMGVANGADREGLGQLAIYMSAEMVDPWTGK